jgi:hypothetical protein
MIPVDTHFKLHHRSSSFSFQTPTSHKSLCLLHVLFIAP